MKMALFNQLSWLIIKSEMMSRKYRDTETTHETSSGHGSA